MKPNPNLWAIELMDSKNSNRLETLLVLASNTEVASRKAGRWAKAQGYTRYTVGNIKHEGTIDVF